MNPIQRYNNIHMMFRCFLNFYSWLRWHKEQGDESYINYIFLYHNCIYWLKENGFTDDDLPKRVNRKNQQKIYFECCEDLDLDSFRGAVFDFDDVIVKRNFTIVNSKPVRKTIYSLRLTY